MIYFTSREVSGIEALRIREEWEKLIVNRLPKKFQPWGTRRMTWLTGLASEDEAKVELPDGSEARAVLRRWVWLEFGKLLATLFTGLFLLFEAPWTLKLFAAPMVISPMRGIVSGVGHVISHVAKGESWQDQLLRFMYDLITAIVWLSPLSVYVLFHRLHHEHTAEAEDPDLQLLEHLGVDFSSARGFIKSALGPRVHFRFMTGRIDACLFDGPIWRRIIVFAVPTLLLWTFPLPVVILFYIVTGIGYHIAALGGFCTLHHFFAPKSTSHDMKDGAVEVTLGRLNLPPATLAGAGELLLGLAVRMLMFPTDPHHCLHHGAWKNSLGPYTAILRTQLILRGTAVRQTVTVGALFGAAFEANSRGLETSTGNKRYDSVEFDGRQVSQL